MYEQQKPVGKSDGLFSMVIEIRMHLWLVPKEETHRRVSPLGIPLCRQGGWITPLEPPIITAGNLICIAVRLLPPGLPQFGLHSVVYSYRLAKTRHAEGINQYATPNRNREDREFNAVPPTFPVGISMQRLRQKASLLHISPCNRPAGGLY